MEVAVFEHHAGLVFFLRGRHGEDWLLVVNDI
jgi:hypothetical protein